LLDDSFHPKTKNRSDRLGEQYGQRIQQSIYIAYLNGAYTLDFPTETETTYYTCSNDKYNHARLPCLFAYHNISVPVSGEQSNTSLLPLRAQGTLGKRRAA